MSGETLRRIQELQRWGPPFGADPATRAAWFEEKAAAFDQIADDDPLFERDARQLADAARNIAQRIRAGAA